MSRLLCCLRARRHDMGAALPHLQDGEACDGAGMPAAPPTMADVIRERKKKALGSGLGTLRRRIALVRRPRDNRPDRGCEHARFIRSVVSSWRLAEVFLVCEELEAGAALRDLVTQAELAREPARALHADLALAHTDRWWCDVELVGAGWSVAAHRAILAARCTYFRDLLMRYPSSCWRVPLEGAAASLSRAELHAALAALYCPPAALCATCTDWEGGRGADGDLDIINTENNSTCLRGCTCGRVDSATLRRLAALLGFSLDSLQHDLRYLLDSGEMSDARLVFRLEGGGSYGFRTALELPCHRVVLAARSRFFRSVWSVMSRRTGGTSSGCVSVCVDESVLPRRFARALLHAAYTDTVDLSLIARNSTSPSSTNSTGSGNTWSGVTRGTSRPLTAAALDDAFQLYDIARFLEMPIVVQGCEDAIVEALTPETLPHVLRWSAQVHASQWVHRQAMRYLRDEFPTIMSSASCGRIPLSALSEALASPFLQASELTALRAVLRWAHTREGAGGAGGAGGAWAARRCGRRREGGDAALRDALQPLLHLLRVEHLPPEHELLQQLVRRGILPSVGGEGAGGAAAWLARGSYRPPRCFLPYLDEIKALLEDQAVPEAELNRARREKYLHKIPDTLYMVSSVRDTAPPAAPPSCGACVPGALRAALRRRAARLKAAPPAVRALSLHADTAPVTLQIALRAVREMSLPDACADLLLPDLENDREQDSEEWESTEERERDRDRQGQQEEAERWSHTSDKPCCRAGTAPRRSSSRGQAQPDTSRPGTCRRETQPRTVDTTPIRSGSCGAGLSAAVPDVAMAPNANTHLLTPRDYFRPAPPWEYSGGGVLQLDLGDGATHTPRPGSRAQRASAGRAQPRDHIQAMSCLRSRADEDELRAAIELSVIRAYSSFGCRAGSVSGSSTRGTHSATLPPHRDVLPAIQPPARGSVSPPGVARRRDNTPPLLLVSNNVTSDSRSPSPRRPATRNPQRYRMEGRYGGSSSRGHSPNTYA